MAQLEYGRLYNQLYAGLAWELPLWRNTFFEITWAAMVHDGECGAPYSPDRLGLGCVLLSRESFSLGYDINQNWRALLTLRAFFQTPASVIVTQEPTTLACAVGL